MGSAQIAVHRTILVVDVEGFGDRHRNNRHQITVRDGLYRSLRRSFEVAGISWEQCDVEDRGDGVFVLVRSDVPKAPFVEHVPSALVRELEEHNRGCAPQEQIRLRMSLHAGEINYDAHGVTAASINLAFRLLDAPALKTELASSRNVLALIVSSWFYDEVVRHSEAGIADSYRPIEVVVKETTTSAWFSLPDRLSPVALSPVTRTADSMVNKIHDTHPAAPTGSAPVRSSSGVRRLLPQPRLFTGRASELAQLTKFVKIEADREGSETILAISGMGGIGKTWLALQWARQKADLFPDGQIYVNLRGFDPAEPPMSPAVAMRRLLDALGQDPGSVPVDLSAQAALYRSLVADRQLLIVLDNARGTAQVEPLLPGSSACTVLVTSRNQLTGLVTAYGACPLGLGVLSRDDARELLALRLGHARVAAEPSAVDELLGYCAGLPLALSIVAAHAATHPSFPLRALASELGQEPARLEALDGGELSVNLSAVLSLSHHALEPAAADMFLLLGMVLGLEISLPAAAALAGLSKTRVGGLLRKLENAHLLQQYVPGRYRMHDLVRLYAAARAEEAGSSGMEAVRRLVGFYLHASHAGERVLYPDRKPIKIDEPTPADLLPTLQDDASTLAWFDTEHSCLLAAQEAAARRGWDAPVWQLAWTMHGYLWRRGHLHDQFATWRAGLAAAQRLNDPAIQALAHRLLGQAAARAGRPDEAIGHLYHALELAREIGDVASEARSHLDLTLVWRQSDDQRALIHATHAVRLFQTLDNPVWQAEALNALGWHQALLGRYDEARENCEKALLIFSDHHNRQGQASTLTSLGYVTHHCGQYAQALALYHDSLSLCRDLGATYDEADTLNYLGKAYAALRQHPEARFVWRQALKLNRSQHRGADADLIQQQLDGLEDC